MRDQLYAALRWPLYSPRRFFLVLLAVVVLLVTVSVLNGKEAPQQPDSGPTAAATTEPSAKPSASPSPSASPDLNQALDTGREFVTAWASHEDKETWLRQVQPFATQQFGEKLASTDPSRIAATEAVSAKNTDTGADNLTSVAVTTDAGVVSVQLMWTRGRWWVYDLQPGAQAVE